MSSPKHKKSAPQRVLGLQERHENTAQTPYKQDKPDKKTLDEAGLDGRKQFLPS